MADRSLTGRYRYMDEVKGLGRYFVLDEKHEVVPVESVHEWGRFTDDPEKVRVAATDVGDLWVSTVFLGVNHRFLGDGPPILFETMVFDHSAEGKRLDEQFMDRYCTWAEAEAGHARVVAALEKGEQP